MVVLDTDHLSLLQQAAGSPAARLRARLDRLDRVQVVTTIVSYEEQMRGWLAYAARGRTVAEIVRAYARLAAHFDGFRAIPILHFDEAAAVEYQRLQKLRLRIGTMDTRIAAIVLARKATLLTRNRVDFEKVPGLHFEDWSA
jgi:tRNA(fMet)-specific endonuclease VapC